MLFRSDRLGVHWEQIYERLPRDSGYSEKNLDLFVTFTLTRMAWNHLKEVQIRFLLCSSLSNTKSLWDNIMLRHLAWYKVRALKHNCSGSESVSGKEGLTIVLPTEQGGLPLDEFLSVLQQRNIGFQVEEPSIQDRRLLDQLASKIGRAHV